MALAADSRRGAGAPIRQPLLSMQSGEPLLVQSGYAGSLRPQRPWLLYFFWLFSLTLTTCEPDTPVLGV